MLFPILPEHSSAETMRLVTSHSRPSCALAAVNKRVLPNEDSALPLIAHHDRGVTKREYGPLHRPSRPPPLTPACPQRRRLLCRDGLDSPQFPPAGRARAEPDCEPTAAESGPRDALPLAAGTTCCASRASAWPSTSSAARSPSRP